MSDNVRRFQAVRTALKRYYPQSDSKRHARHLTTLAAMVAGIVAAGSSHLAKMAQKAPDQTKTEAEAYLWMVYLGVTALHRGWYKEFHRSDRVDLSLFQLGLRLLEHMLNEAWAILVAFIPPPLEPMKSVR